MLSWNSLAPAHSCFLKIKRKHYFQAELNHQFFNNYFGSRK